MGATFNPQLWAACYRGRLEVEATIRGKGELTPQPAHGPLRSYQNILGTTIINQTNVRLFIFMLLGVM